MALKGSRLPMMVAASHAVMRAGSLEALMQALADAARELTGAHLSTCKLIDAGEAGTPPIGRSLSSKYAGWQTFDAVPDGTGIYAVALENDAPLRLTEAELAAHPRWKGFGDWSEDHPPLRGLLVAPMIGNDGRSLGVVMVSDRDDGEFDESDEQVLVLLAQMGTIAVEAWLAWRSRDRERKRLRTILEALPTGVVLVDRDAVPVFANAAALELTPLAGAPLTAPLDDPRWGFLRSGGTPMPREDIPLIRTLATGAPVRDVEVGLAAPDGSRRWLLVTTAPLDDPSSGAGGGRTRAIASFVDITPLKDATAALARSEARLRESQRAGQVGSWESDLGTGATWWSDEAYRIYGFDPGRPAPDMPTFQEHIPAEDLEALHEAIGAAMRPGGRFDHQHRFQRPDGEVRVLHAIGWYAIDGDGRERLVGTVRDVTVERELEEQVQAAQRLESVGRLAAGMAHELNNWLTVVLGHTNLLSPDVGEHDPHLTAIRSAAEHAAELTEHVLAFARQTVLRPRVVGVADLLHSAAQLVGKLVPATIDLAVELDPDLPDVRVDPTRTEQALVNLVLNARDAITGHGRIRLTATTLDVVVTGADAANGLPPGRYARIGVHDTGAGMPSDVLEHALEPFFTTRGTTDHSGLGLSIAHGIVAQSGGRLRVTSEPGRGTEVEIVLPAAVNPRPAPVEPPAQPRPGGAETVLVAEDDAMVRHLAARILERAGYEVLTADDGEEAVKLMASAGIDVDLVVTDVIMPRLTGLELARRLRDRDPDLPILFVSGYTGRTAPDLEIEPPVGLLAKPFRPPELLALVRRLLDERPTAGTDPGDIP